MYVGSHFSGKRSKTIGKSKNNHNDDIFSNFILKTPGIHFTRIRSKATEIMTKSTGMRSKTTELRTESTAIYME